MEEPISTRPLAEANKHLFNNGGDWADLVVKCGSRTWRVHKAILCSRCNFFRAACTENFEEGRSAVIDLSDDSEKGIEMMLEYLHTFQLPRLSLDRAKIVFLLADKYNLPLLRKHAYDRLSVCLKYFTKNFKDASLADNYRTMTLNCAEEVWSWGFEEANMLRDIIADGFVAAASRACKDQDFLDVLKRNDSLLTRFICGVVGQGVSAESSPGPSSAGSAVPSAPPLQAVTTPFSQGQLTTTPTQPKQLQHSPIPFPKFTASLPAAGVQAVGTAQKSPATGSGFFGSTNRGLE